MSNFLQSDFGSAPRVPEHRSNGKVTAAIVLFVVLLLTVTFLLRQASTTATLSRVTLSGTAVTTGYGMPTSVTFMEFESNSGPSGTAIVVNGTYSITLPNNILYVGYVNFQPPTGASGTCGGFLVNIDSKADNSRATYDFSCPSPPVSSPP